ncbi:MAG: outer membrane beta-barrel protein [Prolixibacteraceae bacterium]|nr:outer membrane beta-barrel protein [Prolixibacteraceae bacterium]
MKKYTLTIIFVIAILTAVGQSPVPKGQSQFNAGLGLSSWGVPVYLGLDFGVHNDITVGGELSYRGYHDKINSVNYDHTVIGISGNGNYHFNRVLDIPPTWDLYAGLNAGFYIWNSAREYPGTHTSGLGLGAQIGARYYFSDNVGLNIEFGGGNAFSGGKFGISILL